MTSHGDGSDPHDNGHGRSPAAWTAVTIIMIAGFIASLAVVLAVVWLFWAGMALAAVGVLVGIVMGRAGLGQKPHEHRTGGGAPRQAVR